MREVPSQTVKELPCWIILPIAALGIFRVLPVKFSPNTIGKPTSAFSNKASQTVGSQFSNLTSFACAKLQNKSGR